MSDEIRITEVLYGVVIGGSIQGISLEVTIKNAMLLFALGLLVADWIEYHVSISGSDFLESDSRYVVMIIMDIFVLITWYLMTTVLAEEFSRFILLAGAFFVAISLWTIIVVRPQPKDFITDIELSADWQIAAIFFIIYATQAEMDAEPVFVLSVMTIIWIVRKLPLWSRMVGEEEVSSVISP